MVADPPTYRNCLLVCLLLSVSALCTSDFIHASQTPCVNSHDTPAFRLVHRVPARNVPLLRRNLAAPRVLRLLFASSVSHVTRHSGGVYSVHARFSGAKFRIRGGKGVTRLRLLEHAGGFLEQGVEGVTLVVGVERGGVVLGVGFEGVRRRQVSRKTRVYLEAWLQDLRATVARTVGSVRCEGVVAHPSGWCNEVEGNAGMVGSEQVREWGVTGTVMLGMPGMVNPRVVSERLGKEKTWGGEGNGNANLLMVMFGQFVDHDVVLTPSGRLGRVDGSFQVEGGGRMSFLRSDRLSIGKCCEGEYGQKGVGGGVFNAVTGFVDGSVVYGADVRRMMALREGRGGRLVMKKDARGEWRLPKNREGEVLYRVENANRRADGEMMVAGDVRANENPVLLAFQTVFAREHNRVCRVIEREVKRRGGRRQTDEWVFQQARRVVMAEMQSVVFLEFVPLMLGGNGLGEWGGYDEGIGGGSVDLMFSSAAYRWGHSALKGELWAGRRGQGGRRYGLEETFFNVAVFEQETVEDWLKGAMWTTAGKVDLGHVDAVRQFLFGRLDLMALNIQRGRDHGLPGYLAAREAYGLGRNLRDIEEGVREKIVEVYGGKIETIDAYVGGLAEETVEGGMLGPLFREVVRRQFRRLRDGDRFYFENVRWGKLMSELGIVKRIQGKKVRLAEILMKNTKLTRKDMPKAGAMRMD